MHIHTASASDRADVEILLDSAFGTDRKTRTAYRLREGLIPIPELSFVAREDSGRLTGSIECWALSLQDGLTEHALTLLGPVAVAPTLQRSGLGKQLMAATLMVADAQGFDALMLIGDVEYYGKFGFSAVGTADWQVPGPIDRHRLLVRVTGGRILPAQGQLSPGKAQKLGA